MSPSWRCFPSQVTSIPCVCSGVTADALQASRCNFDKSNAWVNVPHFHPKGHGFVQRRAALAILCMVRMFEGDEEVTRAQFQRHDTGWIARSLAVLVPAWAIGSFCKLGWAQSGFCIPACIGSRGRQQEQSEWILMMA